jgi:hypothetical protein
MIELVLRSRMVRFFEPRPSFDPVMVDESKGVVKKTTKTKTTKTPEPKRKEIIENFELSIDVQNDCLGLTVLKYGSKEQIDFSVSELEWEQMKNYIDQGFKDLKDGVKER